MLSVLKNRTYRHLFFAQIVALSGTGLATVALSLLAFQLAEDSAALVLGTALTIKMVAYVTVAPLAAAFSERLDRRVMLVALDLVRAAVGLALPFVTEVWQIYVLIFILQSASAGFTPTFQATIPNVLQDEKEYTKALSLSRLAVDMESLLSPILAAALLTVMSYDNLFWGTVLGFLASAVLVASVLLPSPKPSKPRGIYDRTTRGMRLYLRSPRLRGLLAVNWVISATGAMVIVNTVVIVRSDLGLSESAVALVLAAFGAGSMMMAMTIPSLLDHHSERAVMLSGAILNILALALLALSVVAIPISMSTIMVGWFAIGAGYSAMLTPGGRVLTRSAHPEDRPSVFAAQFALSHACWLVFYPVSGWLITEFGTLVTMLVLAVLACLGLITAWRIWPIDADLPVKHEHPDLPPDHPHLKGAGPHKHVIIVDSLHRQLTRSVRASDRL